MIRCFDRKGEPISLLDCAARLEKEEVRVVAQDQVGQVGEVMVSTIWTGLQNGTDKQGRPLIFESMIFGGGALNGERRRYATEEESRAGHATLLALVQAAQPKG